MKVYAFGNIKSAKRERFFFHTKKVKISKNERTSYSTVTWFFDSSKKANCTACTERQNNVTATL